MGGNREERIDNDSVHIYLGLSRKSHGDKERCVRHVIKGRGDELAVFIAKLKAIGGNWRVHKTVNARDVHKAMKVLMCRLINQPEKAAYIDTEWRTSLLQPNCIYGDKKFMLDIDTQDEEKVMKVKDIVMEHDALLKMIPSPKGWHFITKPFDTRKVCELDYVTLIRDGYHFVCKIEGNYEN